jgi:hypothetical protein
MISFGPGVSGITIENCGVSCPRCGGYAEIGDGTYSTVGDVLKLDSGPPSTRKMVEELGLIAERALHEKLTAEEVLAEIADVSPDLAQKLRGIGPWPVVGILLLLFWLVKSVTLDLKVDVNWLIDQAWHLGHGDDPDRHLDTLPPEFPEPPMPAPPKDRFGASNLAAVGASGLNRKARRRVKAQTRRSK